jgi:hypothetical protein
MVKLTTVDRTKIGEARKISMNEDLTRSLQKIKLQTASESAELPKAASY